MDNYQLLGLLEQYANCGSISYAGFKEECDNHGVLPPTQHEFKKLLESSKLHFVENVGGHGMEWDVVPNDQNDPANIGAGIQQCTNCGAAMDSMTCAECGAESATQPDELQPLSFDNDFQYDGATELGAGQLPDDGDALAQTDITDPGVKGDPGLEGYDEMRAESISSALLRVVNEHFDKQAEVVHYEHNGKFIPAIETDGEIIFFAANGIKVRKR